MKEGILRKNIEENIEEIIENIRIKGKEQRHYRKNFNKYNTDLKKECKVKRKNLRYTPYLLPKCKSFILHGSMVLSWLH